MDEFLGITDIIELNRFNFGYYGQNDYLTEALDGTPFRNKHLIVRLPDVEDFVTKNDAKEVTNPVFFSGEGTPTSDGLLSYELFGITKEERANIWGYIDLHGTFLHPLIYRLWSRMDSAVPNIVHGLRTYKIASDGTFVPDPDGETGLDFIVKNISKIKIRETDAESRSEAIQFIMKNRSKMFIKKMLVIPPFYRDVLAKSGAGKIEVGQLNKYYSSLLISTRALRETQDMGFSIGESTKGRAQETIFNIYKCITGTSSNPMDGTGLSGKNGIILDSALSKTADYGTRLVLTCPELKVETLDDLMTDVQHCALPIASAIINFKPFVEFAVRRFFENLLGDGNTITVFNSKTGKIEYKKLKNASDLYSEKRIEDEIKEFVYTFSHRFKPVIVETITEDGKVKESPLHFKGYNVVPEKYEESQLEGSQSLVERPLTWCDVFYMATVEATRDKCVLVTRYPYDSAYNQFPQMVNVATVQQTEPMHVRGEFYRWYPRIRAKDVGINTSNMFLDTLTASNMTIENMCGDYDGDTVGIKGVWLQESNKELIDFLYSKSPYIDFSGTCIKRPHHENIQSLFSLTKILSADVSKLTNPTF